MFLWRTKAFRKKKKQAFRFFPSFHLVLFLLFAFAMRHRFLYVFKEEAANMPTDEGMRLKGYAKERGP